MHNIESELISEMEENCKRVEVKMDYDGVVYVIEYTGKLAKSRCPSALITGLEGRQYGREGSGNMRMQECEGQIGIVVSNF